MEKRHFSQLKPLGLNEVSPLKKKFICGCGEKFSEKDLQKHIMFCESTIEFDFSEETKTPSPVDIPKKKGLFGRVFSSVSIYWI